MKTDPDDIEIQEPFARSMATASRMWRRHLDLRFRDLDLSQARWNVLFELSRNEEVTQIELAHRLGIEAATLVRLLDGLEGAGLIERRPSATDRRAKTLHLTEVACPLIVRMKKISATSRAEILEGISLEDLRIATKVLSGIAARLEVLNNGQNG
ncbi:MarR family transcriptional regulator [Citreicella sp. 357]|uniref:MarR family transcriptional regulator, transcriptional regulator for hemolysin n=1 Tax=Salipiger thiooxidans TaxID=282683 RepID=A0A1G7JEZ7_9RHOB|nr:MarR family transcriptional regulator [Salipiger thiooxidans]EIE51238.1 MarR family transcriptional regulator [Citreicella sp. 357]SDF23496.1 MarR family transcriptional regulator, transcriptional regulator for hemolysin [Salipiger thiooxidans]